MAPGKERTKAAKFLGRHGGTLTALVICVLLAIVFYLLYAVTPSEHSHRRELFFHISLALIVAIVLTIVVDYNLSRRHHEELAADVFSAILRKLVPEPLADELQSVLRGEVNRENLRYVITFSKPYNGLGPEYFILRRELSYTLTSAVNRRVNFPVESHVEIEHGPFKVEENGKNFNIPRHVKLTIDNVEIPLVEGKNLFQEENDLYFSHPIKIKRGHSVDVYFCGEEAMRLIGGKNSYIQIHPAVNLSVFINNQYGERLEVSEALLNHPNRSVFKPKNDGSYQFKGGILPGQGFQIGWVPKG